MGDNIKVKDLKKISKDSVLIYGGTLAPGDRALFDSIYVDKISFNIAVDEYPEYLVKHRYIRLIVKMFKAIKNLYKLPKRRKYYIANGGVVALPILKTLGIIHGKVIPYVNTGLPFCLARGEGDINFLDKFALSKADAFISPGKMNVQILHQMFPKKPYIAAYASSFQNLKMRRRPKLNGHNILVIVGLLIHPNSNQFSPERVHYKGLDLVTEAFLKLKKKIPDLKLYVVGQYNDEALAKLKVNKDMYFLGRVKNLSDAVEKCSVCVHMGRGDAFPVSVIDALSLGLPAIVSEYTGSKEIAQKVSHKMIVPLDSNALCDKLSWYFSLKPSERLAMSKKGIKAAESVSAKKATAKFKKDYVKLLNELK
jgi:glycosyltransferase involved in cell wall biosynthesis